MILVSIESPFKPSAGQDTPEGAAELARNVAYARALMLDCLRRGEAPFVSHLLYPQVLAGGDDRDPVDRQLGILAGTEWAAAADVLVIGEDLGITEGMRQRIGALRERWLARDLNVRDRFAYRSLPGWKR